MAAQHQTNKILDHFYNYLSSIHKLYMDASTVLNEELDAIIRDDIDSLNEKLKSQQALFLQTNSFKNTVEQYLEKIDIKADNLTEFIKQLPEDEQFRFYHLLRQFIQTLEDVNFYKEKCKILLQSKLYRIDKFLSMTDLPKDNTTYNQNGSEIYGTLFPKSFETKV